MQKAEFSHEELLNAVDAIAALQKDGCRFPCPRCGGEMREHLLHNSLSRYAQVHICEACGMDKAIRDMSGDVKPLNNWYFISLTANPELLGGADNDYQKLISLLENIDGKTGFRLLSDYDVRRIAVYLLANGVTVRDDQT